MKDIKAGIVRTPLAPTQTMIDDPLRALRTVRFACRLGFTLEEQLEKTLAADEVREALGAKVSKERVLSELNGMLLGPNPARALEMLHAAELLGTVFATPPGGVSGVDGCSPPALAPTWTREAITLVRLVAACSPELLCRLLRCETSGEQEVEGALPREWRRMLYLSCMLAPLKPFHIEGKKKPESLVEHVVRVSLKGTVKDSTDAQVSSSWDTAARAFI